MKAIKQAKILATSLIEAEAPADAASITFLCGLGKEDYFSLLRILVYEWMSKIALLLC